jgi:hypothetical protein
MSASFSARERSRPAGSSSPCPCCCCCCAKAVWLPPSCSADSVGIPAAAAAAATTPAAAGRPPQGRPPAGRCLRSLTCSTTCHRAEASRWEQRCRLQLPAVGSRLLRSGCNIAASQQTAIKCFAIESRRVRDWHSEQDVYGSAQVALCCPCCGAPDPNRGLQPSNRSL